MSAHAQSEFISSPSRLWTLSESESTYSIVHIKLGVQKLSANVAGQFWTCRDAVGKLRVVRLQLRGEGDMEDASLVPWQALHRGGIAALDVNSDTREVRSDHLVIASSSGDFSVSNGVAAPMPCTPPLPAA